MNHLGTIASFLLVGTGLVSIASTLFQIRAQTKAMSESKSSNSLDWKKGRTLFEMTLVKDGRIRKEDLPPVGETQALREQFSDVILVSHRPTLADQVSSLDDITYRDALGEPKTKEDYDAYIARWRPNENKNKSGF